MSKKKLLRELAYSFCKELDKEIYSAKIISPNDYVNVAIITSVKTNKTKLVYFDFFCGEISFWNDFDEKFACGLDEQGAAELFEVFEWEVSQVCYFNFLSGGKSLDIVPAKIPVKSDDNILEAFKEYCPYKKEKFDEVSVEDFTGSINKKIIYDQSLLKYICIDNKN